VREGLFPNAGAPAGVRTVRPFGAVLPRRPGLLVRAATELPAPPDDPARALALLGARLVVTRAEGLGGSSLLEPAAHLGPWALVRVRGAPPWAQLLARAERVDGPEEAFARLRRGELDPRGACVVEGGDALDQPPGEAGRVTVEALDFDRLALSVQAERPGVLLVREAWAPGWTARVDGAPAPVVPADLAFRAVAVPAGARRVELRYLAPGGRAGRSIAGAAWSALLLLLLWRARVRSLPPGPPPPGPGPAPGRPA
jgi:hypothetical protein